jgi:hypothetical protein
MARDAVGAQLEAKDALLGDADVEHPPTVERDHRAAALVEQVVAAHGVGVLTAQELGTVVAAGLLVGDAHDLQRAARRTPSLPRQPHRRDDLGGDLSLHVLGAAAPYRAVHELSRPRIAAPLLGRGEHGVDVAEIAEGRPGRVAGEGGDQVRAVLEIGEDLAFEPRLRQQAVQELDRLALGARRVDRVQAQKGL